MLASHWDTSAAEPHQRFDFYRSGLCANFAHLTPQLNKTADDFSASLANWTDVTNSLTRIYCQDHLVERTRDDLKQVEDDCLYLNFIAKGEMHIRQGNTTECLRSGDIIVLDNARPFEARTLAKGGNMHFAFRMPRHALPDELTCDPKLLSNLPGSHILRQQFSLIATAPDELRSDLMQPAFQILNTVLAHMASHPEETHSFRRFFRTKSSVERIIAENHADPGLCLRDVAAELRLPQRTLQNHLAMCGASFSQLLREFRLNRAFEMICGGTDMSFEDIALSSGFADLSTFYRSFKRKFGNAPGHYRKRH